MDILRELPFDMMRYNKVEPKVICESLSQLSKRELELVLTIYHSPGCMMTPNELEKSTGLKSIHVGNAGKHLGAKSGVDDFGSYWDGEYRVAYFQMIGEYHGEKFGWVMNHNLRMGIKLYLAQGIGRTPKSKKIGK